MMGYEWDIATVGEKMTDKKLFSVKDFEKILQEVIDNINMAYADKMDMRDVSLLSWYSILVYKTIEVEYDKRTGGEE